MADEQTEALTAILVTPPRRASLREAEAEASAEVLAGLRAYPCETPDDEAALADILHSVKARAKEVEEMRTTITGPLNAAKRAVDGLFKPALSAMAEAEAIIKSKLAGAHERREAANRARLEAAAASARAGDTMAASRSLAEVSTAKPEGVSFRCTWTHVVEDVALVPREWLTVDGSKVKIHLAKFNDGHREPEPVPGLRFIKTTGVIAR
jgi:hypothetical protein